MNAILGDYSLAFSVLLSALVFVLAITAAILRPLRLTKLSNWSLILANWGLIAFTALVTIASGFLLNAILTNDFSLDYVRGYSEKALPLGYKIAAFWAGQGGSLLFWAWTMAIMSMMVVIQYRKRFSVEQAVIVATLALVSGFFTATMLFVPEANPFKVSAGPIPLDGRGLNPMLQNPGMILHPPILFLGYAGCLIPFAFLMGALFANRSDNLWLANIRRWVLSSWVFLTVGIILGSWWAYVELGWGGYWAWDPVENASLLPWLTLTALLHSTMAQQHRGVLKIWNAALIAVSFILCLLGTWITRSGVISSVHAFGESDLGIFFLVFMVVATLVSTTMILVRSRTLKPQHEFESIFGYEGAFLASNVMFTIMMLATLIGTMWPVISRSFLKAEVTPTPDFYNKFVLPLALVIVGLMAVGPLLAYGRDATDKALRKLPIPGIVGLVVLITMYALGMRSAWAISCAVIVMVALVNVVGDYLRSVGARKHNTHENFIVAAIRLLDSNHRRYGGQLAHIGMLMLVIGVAWSSLFTTNEKLILMPGESGNVAGYEVKFIELTDANGPNYDGLAGLLEITAPNGQSLGEFRPEKRKFRTWEELNTEVDYRSNLVRDVYVTLLGWEAGGSPAAFQVHITPMVIWIWIGGIVMTVGGFYAFLPRLLPRSHHQVQAVPMSMSVTSSVHPTAIGRTPDNGGADTPAQAPNETEPVTRM